MFFVPDIRYKHPYDRKYILFGFVQRHLRAHAAAVASLRLSPRLEELIWDNLHWTLEERSFVTKTFKEARRSIGMGKSTRISLALMRVRAHSWMLDDMLCLQLLTMNCPKQVRRASPRMQDHRDLIREAALRDPRALVNASDRLKNDKALIARVDLSKSASRRIIGERDYGLSLLRAFPRLTLSDFSDELRDDPAIVALALANKPSNLKFVSERWRTDRETVRAAVAAKGAAILCAPSAFLDDEEIVLLAVKTNYSILYHVSKRLKDKIPFLIRCVETDAGSYHYVKYKFRRHCGLRRAAGIKLVRGRTDEDDLREFI
jgi:hypothetical protein